MAKYKNPTNAVQIEKDRLVVVAVKNMTDFAPANKDATVEKVEALQNDLDAATVEHKTAWDRLERATTRVRTAEKAFHKGVGKMKNGVLDQYGENSDEITQVGLKKQSERRRRTRKAKNPSQPK